MLAVMLKKSLLFFLRKREIFIKRKKGAYFNVGAFYVPGGIILRVVGLLYQTRDERNQSKKEPIVGSTSTDSHSNEVTPPWPIPTIGPNIIIRYVTSCVNHKMGKGQRVSGKSLRNGIIAVSLKLSHAVQSSAGYYGCTGLNAWQPPVLGIKKLLTL